MENENYSFVSLTRFLKSNSFNGMGRGRIQKFIPILEKEHISITTKKSTVKINGRDKLKTLYFMNAEDGPLLLGILDVSKQRLDLMRNPRSGVLLEDDFIVE